jgi:hypothetical protein
VRRSGRLHYVSVELGRGHLPRTQQRARAAGLLLCGACERTGSRAKGAERHSRAWAPCGWAAKGAMAWHSVVWADVRVWNALAVLGILVGQAG